ncbi:MAG: hypothetical protein AAF590_00075 [Pseudomonadota bacterium]
MQLKTKFLSGVSLCVLATGFAMPAQAQVVTVIQDGQVVNVQQVLNGDDTLIIEQGGELNVGQDAVSAVGDDNVITNSGSISTTGTNSVGILSGDNLGGGANAVITNSGSI